MLYDRRNLARAAQVAGISPDDQAAMARLAKAVERVVKQPRSVEEQRWVASRDSNRVLMRAANDLRAKLNRGQVDRRSPTERYEDTLTQVELDAYLAHKNRTPEQIRAQHEAEQPGLRQKFLEAINREAIIGYGQSAGAIDDGKLARIQQEFKARGLDDTAIHNPDEVGQGVRDNPELAGLSTEDVVEFARARKMTWLKGSEG